jgi:4-carboxymuconolactone decarboxylase
MTDDPERAALGDKTFREVVGYPPHPPSSPLTEAARDFVFAEVWARPGLDRRSRRWITLSAVCATGEEIPMRTYLKAALDSGDITVAELREFALQFAVFQGFPRGVKIELMVSELEKAQGSK